MKRISHYLVAGLILCGLSGTALAQDNRDAIEVLRGQINADRQAVVAANIEIPENQSEAFWPLYREYHGKRSELMDTRVKLLTEFRDNYIGLTAEQADQLLDDALKLEKDLLKLKEKYHPKFRKILTARGTLRYFQLENKLDTIVNYNLVQVVPLSN
jgi:hypothetical protein